MKTIKHLTVTVTYHAGFGDVEVPDNVFEVLSQGGQFDFDDYRLSDKERETLDWLNENIKESDAYSGEYEFESNEY